ncbi:hypothetical protein GCM10027033_26600 [Leucobacter ruminantium]
MSAGTWSRTVATRFPDFETEDLPAPVCCDADGNDNGLGDDPATNPGLAVGCVEEHVRVALIGEGPVAERGDILIEVLADTGHLRFRDPGVCAECFHEIIDLPGRDTMNVGLHHHREQGLVDAAASLQQGREEGALPQFRDA